MSASAPPVSEPVEEEVRAPSLPTLPPPSITTNARLEELASLSEKTLEDYETFGDLDNTASKGSKRTPVIILASLLGVAILAGGAIFAYRQGVRESGPTTLPVIVAGTKAIKEQPDNPGGVKIPNQNKLIYDRILGEETDIAERIISREEQVVNLSQQPATTTVRKTLPSSDAAGSQARTNPAAGTTTERFAEDQVAKKLAEAALPKPVAPPDSLTGANVPEAVRPLTETLNLPSRVQNPATSTQGNGIVRLETETVTGVPDVPPVPGAPQQTAEKKALAKLVEEAIGINTPPEVKAKVPPVLPRRKPPVPTRVARALVPATAAPATAARSTSGNFVIQIAAFRSREEALSRFAALKRRHSSLLGPYTSFVQRADLGDRGIYYRLRLGPIDGKEKASTLCRSLKSAGEKDCLVRTR